MLITLKSRFRKTARMMAYMQNISEPSGVSIPENEKPIIRAHDIVYNIPANAQREETSKVFEMVAFDTMATDESPTNAMEAGGTPMLLLVRGIA
jgi:hypothetical protein